MIAKGNNNIKAIYKGNDEIVSIYKGNNLVFNKNQLKAGYLIQDGKITNLGKAWGIDKPLGNPENLLFPIKEDMGYAVNYYTSNVEEISGDVPYVRYKVAARTNNQDINYAWFKYYSNNRYQDIFTKAIIECSSESNPNPINRVRLWWGTGNTQYIQTTRTFTSYTLNLYRSINFDYNINRTDDRIQNLELRIKNFLITN